MFYSGIFIRNGKARFYGGWAGRLPMRLGAAGISWRGRPWAKISPRRPRGNEAAAAVLVAWISIWLFVCLRLLLLG
jgi:hypothetical protein